MGPKGHIHSAASSTLKATIWAVTVVPRVGPIMTPMDCVMFVVRRHEAHHQHRGYRGHDCTSAVTKAAGEVPWEADCWVGKVFI